MGKYLPRLRSVPGAWFKHLGATDATFLAGTEHASDHVRLQPQLAIQVQEEFCSRVAERTGGRPRTAEWDASAVLSTVADSVSGGQLNQIPSLLPSGYAVLFGKPDLA